MIKKENNKKGKGGKRKTQYLHKLKIMQNNLCYMDF
jgi:hypothetical protein